LQLCAQLLGAFFSEKRGKGIFFISAADQERFLEFLILSHRRTGLDWLENGVVE
jgi:hypothetical protein